MLLIRNQQLKVFEQAAFERFEDEMLAHSRSFSPRLTEILGDDQLSVAVRAAISTSGSYGFTNRGPIRLFIELMFLWGSGFDTDPQYPAVGKLLRAPSEQMHRAQQIHESFLDYLDKVSGPGARNVHRALRDLLAFVRSEMVFSADFVTGMLEDMHRIFPQKAAYVGEPGLRALIDEAIAEAERARLCTARQRCLLVVLRFAFGHGCTCDPLYPWIGRTLRDERIPKPADRAARLERKAITWLEHVVARNDQRSRT